MAGSQDRGAPLAPLYADLGVSRGFELVGLRIAQYVVLLIVSVVVARALGPAMRAEYALALALAVGVWLLIGLSLDTAAGALLARGEASVYALSRLLATAVVALGALGFTATCVIGIPLADDFLSGASSTAVVIAAATVPPTLAAQMAIGLLSRIGALRPYGLATVTGAAVQLVFVAIVDGAWGLTPETAILGAVLGWVAIALPLWVVLARRIGVGALVPSFSAALVARLIKAAAVLHPSTLALALMLRVDLFIVSALTSPRETGLYSLAATLAETVFLGAWSLAAAAMQMQTEAPLQRAARYTLEFIRQSWLVTAAAASVLALAALPLVRVFYGAEWTGSVPALMILTLAAVALAVEAPARVLLARVGRYAAISFVALLGLAVNVLANFALIPLLGIAGAAIASVIAYWLYTVLLLRVFRSAMSLSLRPMFQPPHRDDEIVQLGLRALALSRLRRSAPRDHR
jgi:stage V sporulation protein B